MLTQNKRNQLASLLPCLLVIAFLTTGCLQPARAESQPRTVFYSYIKELYYAHSVRQVSRYWTKNNRVPMDECLGDAEKAKLAELKRSYVSNPKIDTEVLDGNTCTMKGTGIALADGQTVRARLDVIMSFEESNWRIQYYTWRGEVRGNGY